jgi:hypothetical protein
VGGTVNLTASDIIGATYAWTGPNGFTSALQNPSIENATVAASGEYSVVATVDGCSSVAATTVVTVNALPEATASSNSPVDEGSAISLVGGPADMASYAWTGPNGFTSSEQSPTIASATLEMSGEYTLTVTNSSGCTSTASVSVTVNEAPAANITGTIEMETFSGNDYSITRDVHFVATNASNEILKTWDVPVEFTNDPNAYMANGTYSLDLSGISGTIAHLSARTNWSLRRRMDVAVDQTVVDFVGYGEHALRGGDIYFYSAEWEYTLEQNNWIDGDDFNVFFYQWDTSGAESDLNGDGWVDGDDFNIFFTNWDQGGDEE